MRSDDLATGNARSDDMTADELLLRLNKIHGGKPNEKKAPRDTASKISKKEAPKALEIDESVYESAEKELRYSDAVRATDDSDLDIDELFEKFIEAPRREREASADSERHPLTDDDGNEIVKELTPAGGTLSAVEETDVDAGETGDETVDEVVTEEVTTNGEEITTDTLPESADESVQLVAQALENDLFEQSDKEKMSDVELMDAVMSFEESVSEDDDDDIEEPLIQQSEDEDGEDTIEIPAVLNAAEELSDDETVYFDDSDVKLASDDDTAGSAFDEPFAGDDEKTAVFDISLVKELAESGELTMSEEELASSQTEVFSVLKPEDIAGLHSDTDVQPVAQPDGLSPELMEADTPISASAVYGDLNGDTIDQADLDLMVALGMEDELVDTVGAEQATAIGDEIVRAHDETTQMQAAAAKTEFTSYDQETELLLGFKNRYYLLIVRIIAAIVLLGTLFVYENYGMLGLEMPDFARPSSYPIVYAMLDLQLVVLCGALVGRQFIDGVKNIIKLKPTPECMTAFVFILSAIYTLIICFIAPVGGFELYNMPVALAAVAALIYEFLNLRRDVLSFKIVASQRKKFVINPVSGETETLEREAFEEFVPAESEIVRVGKTDFVDGFFARTEEKKVTKPIVGIMIPVVLLLAIAFVVLTFVKTRSIYDSVSMAFMTAGVTVPLTSFIIYSFPFYRASKESYDNGSTIIGESSLTEYSNSAVISFEDKEVFPSAGVKVTSVKVYGNNRIDEIIYKFASAFMKVGGPLADVFKQAIRELGHSENVELIEVDDDGITVSVDDVQVYIGKSSYMEKKDYEPPYDHEGRRQEQEGTVSVLYIAYSGQLAAKLYVRYTIDGEFEKIMSQLYKTGLCVGIKSFDPNIDDLLLSKKIKTTKYPVKVIRSKNVEDIPHIYERCDSGIVSIRSVKSLLKTVALCERVGNVIKTNLIVSALSMLIGVVVMSFIYAFGDTMTFTSLYITLYQLFWAIPVLLISKFLI